MPTKREREYYAMGYRDGVRGAEGTMGAPYPPAPPLFEQLERGVHIGVSRGQPKKRKLSAWNKYVKANSKKPRFRYRNGKLNLKKMAIAFRKTPAGKKKRR